MDINENVFKELEDLLKKDPSAFKDVFEILSKNIIEYKKIKGEGGVYVTL